MTSSAFIDRAEKFKSSFTDISVCSAKARKYQSLLGKKK
jgi:hypothetical protein